VKLTGEIRRADLSGRTMRDADDPLAMTRRSVRARTLVLLRWMAVGGQSATVLFVQFFLGFDVELAA